MIRVSSYAQAMLLDPRNGPNWDLHGAHNRTYVVASTPRTGSTLLCRTLWDTGLAGAPKEYLNPMQIRDWEVRLGSATSATRHRLLSGPLLGLVGRLRWSAPRVDAHLARVQQLRTGSNGWFGLKLHAHHHRRWFRSRPLAHALGPVTWIRIRREDRVAQAVSWERALQTGRWAAHQRPTFTLSPVYRRRAIERRLRAIAHDEAWWDAVLENETVLDLTFERLRTVRAATIRQVLTYLDVPGGGGVGVPDDSLRSQSDGISQDWIRRFRSGQ